MSTCQLRLQTAKIPSGPEVPHPRGGLSVSPHELLHGLLITWQVDFPRGRESEGEQKPKIEAQVFLNFVLEMTHDLSCVLCKINVGKRYRETGVSGSRFLGLGA